MNTIKQIDVIGCLKIWGWAVVIVLCIALYNYFSIKPLPKEELIQRGVEYFDRNRKGFNSVVNAIHLLKFPREKGAKLEISTAQNRQRLYYSCDDSLFHRINENVYDSIVSLVNYHKKLCHHCWVDSIGNFSHISEENDCNIKRSHYKITFIVDADEYNWGLPTAVPHYHFYPHDSIPIEETHWGYQIEGNWYLISP